MGNTVEINKKGYSAVLDSQTGNLVSLKSSRGTEVVFSGGKFGAVTYTENDAKNVFSERYVEWAKPYPALVLEDKFLELKSSGENTYENGSAKTQYHFTEDAVELGLTADSALFSQLGLHFDINFMDKDQEGDFRDQWLHSYPYSSRDGSVQFFGFNTPNDEWLLIMGLDALDGWRIIYDCHDLHGFQMLRHFDRRLKSRDNDGKTHMNISISLHNGLEEMLGYVEKTLGIVLPRLTVSAVQTGGEICVKVGDAKETRVYDPENNEVESHHTGDEVKFIADKEGFYTVETVSKQGNRADATVFCFTDWKDFFIRATDAVREPYHCDFNLCEGAMWLQSTLIRENFFGLDEKCEERINGFIRDNMSVTRENQKPEDWGKILPFEHEWKGKKYSAYHTYGLERVQNQVTQAMCMVELYKLRKDRDFLDLAANYIINIINDHMNGDGCVYCANTDYATVTCLLHGFIDVMNFLQLNKDERYRVIYDASVQMTEHLIRRGFNFPTEGVGNLRQMEDGSISCTALSLLYSYLFLKRDKRYLDEALKVLELHDSWCMQVNDVRMYQSTLRWWETCWEGDADGSGINCGHAWTIWKAEADFWYAYAANDFARAVKSFNGYMTNLCKVRPDGRMYTSYTPDYITGQPYLGKITHGYPERTDSSMPYYLWTRAADTWMFAAGVKLTGEKTLLNTTVEEGDTYRLTTAAVELRRLFFAGADKPIEIDTTHAAEIIPCGVGFAVKTGIVISTSENKTVIQPVDGKIIITEEK